jgi:hypothetical protein
MEGVHHGSIDFSFKGKEEMKKYGNRNIVTVGLVLFLLKFVMLYIFVYVYISSYWFFVQCVKGLTPFTYVPHTALVPLLC